MLKTVFSCLTIATISTITVSASNINFQDNFDYENHGIGQLNYDEFNNWNVTRGAVDLKGNKFYDFYPNNGLYLDLDGTKNSAVRLESKNRFLFNKGDKVGLSFDILGENIQTGFEDNFFTISLGDFLSKTYDINSIGTNTLYLEVPQNFISSLVLDHKGGDNGGLIIDNVKLISVSESKDIPEPNSLLPYALISLTLGFKCLLSKIIN